MDEAKQKTTEEGTFSQLPCDGGELVRTADKTISVRVDLQRGCTQADASS